MSTPANILTATLLVQIPKRFPHCRLWRSNRIDAIVPGRGGKLRRVQAGVDGQGDITGVFPIWMGSGYKGIRLEIEVKAGADRQSTDQKAFEKMITDAGAIYILARSVEQCLEDLGKWV